jgi:hypothetical protein
MAMDGQGRLPQGYAAGRRELLKCAARGPIGESLRARDAHVLQHGYGPNVCCQRFTGREIAQWDYGIWAGSKTLFKLLLKNHSA